jgi:hypothetical protein
MTHRAVAVGLLVNPTKTYRHLCVGINDWNALAKAYKEINRNVYLDK